MIYKILQKIKTLKELLDSFETITTNEELVVDIGNNKENIEYISYEKDEIAIYKNLDSEEYEVFRMEFIEIHPNLQRIEIEVDGNLVMVDIDLKDVSHDTVSRNINKYALLLTMRDCKLLMYF